MAGLERLDEIIHVRCTKAFLNELDRSAKSVGVARADYLRMLTTLALRDRELKLVVAEKAKEIGK